MPTQLLPCGVPVVLQTNVAYALPVVATTIFCGDSSPTLQQSNTEAFTTNSPIVLTSGQAQCAGGFIRATAGTPLVIFSRD